MPVFASPSVIPFYTYNEDPPFNTSLSQDSITMLYARLLSEHSRGQYLFKPVQIPRLRLDRMLESPNWDGVIAWENPRWFFDNAKRKFIWSQAIIQDMDLVVSNVRRPVAYDKSLMPINHLTLGAIYGYVFDDVDSALASGKITLKREDVISHEKNLEKLKLQRIDVTFVARSSLIYYLKKYPQDRKFFSIADVDRGNYFRYLFVSLKNKKLMDYINTSIPVLDKNLTWQIMRNTYFLPITN